MYGKYIGQTGNHVLSIIGSYYYNNPKYILDGNNITGESTIGRTLPSYGTSDSMVVGSSENRNRYYIYAIRIYIGLLSDSDVLNNQKIDNERFNLGLNL
jgi:hypothetical protein